VFVFARMCEVRMEEYLAIDPDERVASREFCHCSREMSKDNVRE